MNDKDKLVWLEKLVDTYGFYFKDAYEIIHHPNSEIILSSVVRAYKKGVSDGTPKSYL